MIGIYMRISHCVYEISWSQPTDLQQFLEDVAEEREANGSMPLKAA